MLQRIGVGVVALPLATIVTAVFGHVGGGVLSSRAVLCIIFVTSYAACYLVWNWIFFARSAELRKRLPITGVELRRKRKEFYDNLPR